MASAESIAAKIHEAAHDIEDEVEDAIETSTEEMEKTAESTLRSNDNVAHGVLVGSLTTRSHHSDKYDTASSVVSQADHSPFVEYGTGIFNTGDNPFNTFKSPDPGPPRGKIRQWIIRKGITPTYSPDGRGIQPSENLIDDQERLAAAIADHIATYGTRSYPYMRPSYRTHEAETIGRVADGISDAFDNLG